MVQVDREWKKCIIRAYNKLSGAQQFRVMIEAACLIQCALLMYSHCYY